MTLHTGWLAPTGQTRQATRHTAFGGVTPANPLQSRSGILPGSHGGQHRVGGLWMDGLSPMTATVYHGRAVIQGTTTQGPYPVTVERDTVVSFTDSDAQNPRIDLVVLRVYDTDYDGSLRSEAAIEVVRGTPAPTPAQPAAPDLSLSLFAVRVPAGTSAGTGGINWSSALTDLRATVVGVGGILPVYNNSAVAGAYPGQYQDNDNAGLLQRWNGTAWVAYPKAIGGIAPSGTLTAGSYTGQYRDSGGVLQRWNGTAWSNYQPPVEVETTTTGVTMLANWALQAFSARRTRGVCTVSVTVTRSGADVTAGSTGNIVDEPLCVLPAGWRPVFDTEAPASDGFGSGGAYISTGGQVTLRTWSSNGALVAGRGLRIAATYVL